MPRHDRRWAIRLGLILTSIGLAPAQRQDTVPAAIPATTNTDPASLAKIRAEAGAMTYDLTWSYYSQNRVDADLVYRWSRRTWEADRDAATDRTGRVTAAESHLARMLKLEEKIAKIRQIGFGTSLNVLEAEYYRKEAEFWRAEAMAH